MDKILIGVMYLLLSVEASASSLSSSMFGVSFAASIGGKVVDVEGASIGEIASRTESGISTFYKIASATLVLVGFFLFAGSIIRLIKINRGEIPNAKPASAFFGMIFAAMLASTGVWLFATKNSLEKTFAK